MNRTKTLITSVATILAVSTPAICDLWIGYLGGRSAKALAFDKERRLLWIATAEDGAFSFDGSDFTRYNTTTTQGRLASDFLSCSLIAEGEIWFGTAENGMSRFNPDTQQWKNYNKQNDGLISDMVNALASDTLGNIWIATVQGVSSLDPRTGKWTSYDTSNGLSDNNVRTIAVDQDNNKWFGTRERGVSVLKADGSWCYFLPGKAINAIQFEPTPQGDIKWFGLDDHTIYKLASRNINCADTSTFVATLNGSVFAIWVDEAGNKWFGTTRGATRLDQLGNLREFNEPTNLDVRVINAIVGDNDGNLWFGIGGKRGVIKYSANWITFGVKDGLQANSANVLAEDARGGIWAGTINHLFELKGLQWQAHTFNQNCFDRKDVRAIAFDASGGMWLGTISCGVVYFAPKDSSLRNPIFYTSDNSDLIDDTINDIAIFRDEVWFATQLGLSLLQQSTNKWTTFTSDSGLINNHTTSVDVDNQGNVWCGTLVGVSYYDRKTKKWQSFTTRNGLAGNWINDIVIDSTTGKIWFATEGYGASSYDPRQSVWQNYTAERGLASDFVRAIALEPDSAGVWFGTVNGVSLLDAAGAFYTYTTQNGLGENLVTSVLRDSRGRLWFGSGLRGITRYKRQAQRPTIRLLTRFDVTINTEIVYDFLGADLGTSANLLRYAYKLENEPEYSPWSFNTFARVPILRNGLHTFAVKAIDSDGNESEVVKDTFYKFDPDSGATTTLSDTTQWPKLGMEPANVKLYWPPYQFQERLAAVLRPVPADSLGASTLFAFDLAFQDGGLDTLLKPVTLTFSFPQQSQFNANQLAIYREEVRQITGFGGLIETVKDTARLGGTVKIENDMIHLSAPIRKLGRYFVQDEARIDASSSMQEAAKATAQPRIFSPYGNGHGPETTLSFQLQSPANVLVKVYNLAGRLVKTVWDQHMNAGLNAVAWNGRDEGNRICPSGLYLMVMESSGFQPAPPKPVKVMVLNE